MQRQTPDIEEGAEIVIVRNREIGRGPKTTEKGLKQTARVPKTYQRLLVSRDFKRCGRRQRQEHLRFAGKM